LHYLQAVGTLLQTLRLPSASCLDALGDGEVSRFAFATRPDACANAWARKSVFVTRPDILEDACDLKCRRLDAHLTVRTTPEIKCEMNLFGSFFRISLNPTRFFVGFSPKTLDIRLSKPQTSNLTWKRDLQSQIYFSTDLFEDLHDLELPKHSSSVGFHWVNFVVHCKALSRNLVELVIRTASVSILLTEGP
jgi:hypothetical protein